jgi:hypothetical protein
MENDKHRGFKIMTGLVIMLGIPCIFNPVGGDYSNDPKVAALEFLRDQKFSNSDTMTAAQINEASQDLKKKAEGLSAEQQRKLWASSMPTIMPTMMKQAEKDIDRFLDLSPQEQQREMDKKINEELNNHKSNKTSSKPQLSPAEFSEFLKRMLDWTTPEQRAKFDTVKKMYQDRKQNRGS